MRPRAPIALARVSGHRDRRGYWPITFGGEGLLELELPIEVILYRPGYDGHDLNRLLEPARSGPDPDGQYLPGLLQEIKLHEGRGRKTGGVRIQAVAGSGFPTDLQGWWICIEKVELGRADDELYVFELLGMPVAIQHGQESVGQVIDYMESGAHGVITIRLHDESLQEIMVPYLNDFVQESDDGQTLLIPELMEFAL